MRFEKSKTWKGGSLRTKFWFEAWKYDFFSSKIFLPKNFFYPILVTLTPVGGLLCEKRHFRLSLGAHTAFWLPTTCIHVYISTKYMTWATFTYSFHIPKYNTPWWMACHKCKFHKKWLKMAISGYFAEMLPKAKIWPKKSIFWSKTTKKMFQSAIYAKRNPCHDFVAER